MNNPERIKVLVADDEPILLGFEEKKLHKLGFICMKASTVAMARKIVQKGFLPHVAIVDAGLVDGEIIELESRSFGLNSGMFLCRWIIEYTDGLTRVMIRSGLDSLREIAQVAGAWAFISKPSDWSDMDEIVSAMRRGYLTPEEKNKPTLYFRTEYKPYYRSR